MVVPPSPPRPLPWPAPCAITAPPQSAAIATHVNAGSRIRSLLHEFLKASAGAARLAPARQAAVDIPHLVCSQPFGTRPLDEGAQRTVLRAADANPVLPPGVADRVS